MRGRQGAAFVWQVRLSGHFGLGEGGGHGAVQFWGALECVKENDWLWADSTRAWNLVN
jgi:hypothetical protein